MMAYLISAIISGISVTGCLVVAFLLLLFAFAVDKRKKTKQSKKYNLPPGPKGAPILGTFPSFLKAPAHIVFEEWTKKYGNVFKFTVGRGTSVVLGDVATIREAFVNKSPVVDSRCQWRYCFNRMFRGLSVLPYSLRWLNTRRRTLTILRNFGMGKSSMEEKIHEETKCLMKCLLEAGKNGKVNFDPKDMIRRTPTNILCSILFGKRYDYENPRLLYIMNTIAWLANFLATASIYDILPDWLKKMTGFSLRNYHKSVDDLNQFLKDKVDEHKESYKQHEATNFVDAWLKARDEDNKQSFHGSVTPPNGHIATNEKVYSELPDVLQDLVVAGAHSTGLIFNWCILLLILNKDAQDKAYNDIMEVIGPDRTPSMRDRPKLPYIEALFNEVMRIATLLPLVAHATGSDTTIGGYDVPADIEVMYNNWSLNRDEKVYPEPNVFKPSRWLNDEGEIRKELLHGFFPFGVGKRTCVGEALARMNIFVTLTTLIQNLEFLPPDSTVAEDLKPAIIHKIGLLADCKKFMLRVRKRACVPAA